MCSTACCATCICACTSSAAARKKSLLRDRPILAKLLLWAAPQRRFWRMDEPCRQVGRSATSYFPANLGSLRHHADTRTFLLLNLGTPDAPTPDAVRRYLREFLSDPRVIDIHPIARFLLLHLDLAAPSASQCRGVSENLDPFGLAAFGSRSRAGTGGTGAAFGQMESALAMRYQKSVAQTALHDLTDCERIVVLPLYPQYSSASTGSSLEELLKLASAKQVTPNLSVVPPFFAIPATLPALSPAAARSSTLSAPITSCFRITDSPNGRSKVRPEQATLPRQRRLLRAAFVGQSKLLSRPVPLTPAARSPQRLGYDGESSTCFQSRLGRTPWIRPYTDEVISSLLAQGKNGIVVVCPAFVADCLETIEEIGMRAKADFLARGGESLTLIPSLNSDEDWADAICAMVASPSSTKTSASAGTNLGDDRDQSSP